MFSSQTETKRSADVPYSKEVCVQTTMREANDRGYECLLVEDATESYFPEFKKSTLAMITAQNAIVGWTAKADDVVAAMASL